MEEIKNQIIEMVELIDDCETIAYLYEFIGDVFKDSKLSFEQVS